MQKQFCLIGKNDSTRKNLSIALKSLGFEEVGSFEDVSEIEIRDQAAEFLAIIDDPDSGHQRNAVKNCKSIFPSSTVIVLSKNLDLNNMLECFKLGAVEYIVESQIESRYIGTLCMAALGKKGAASNASVERPAA